MNAYSTLDAAKRLRAAGVPLKTAEALAAELGTAMDHHVTKEQMDAALTRHTLLICSVLGTLIVTGCAILGVIISLHH
jgi:hypothetical protein